MVENDTSSVEYTLSTSTGPFDIPFYFIENGHISAWLYTENSDGSYDETTLTLDTDYTLTGAGDSDGGTLTLTETHDGAILLIARSPDATQQTSYVATGKFPATSHERALDKLTMLIQQIYWWWDDLPLKRPNIFANFYHAKNRFIKYLKDPVDDQDAATKNYADGLYDGAISHADAQFKRTLRVPESSIGVIPGVAARKNHILAFNSAGNPITVLPESGSAADVLIDLGSSEDGLGAGLVAFSHKAKYAAGTIAALAIANFQDEQPIQYYYDNNGGDWDEAIFEAQLAVYLYGFSPRLRLPHGIVEITRPILGGVALGDYIHENYPDLNFYDSSTGSYAAVWPLHLEGTYLYASDVTSRTTLGTQIKLTVDDNTVTTYKDMGIIHAGPTEYEQVRRTATTTKLWPGQGLVIRNVNISGNTTDGSTFPWMHGIYAFGSAKNLIENVVVNNVWGAGILFDWVFDSLIKNVRFMGCGRMQTRTYYDDGMTSADYQLYAPFMTLFSPGSNVSDNTNFIRLEGCHWEDNYVAADVIIAGTASPVWITDPHFECASYSGTSAGDGTKTCLCAGGFGVRYFMEESQDGWDSTAATVRTSAGQGNVLWRGGGIYSSTYEYQVQQAGYGTVSLESNLFPNYSKVRVRTSSTGAGFRAVNSILGDISFSGGNSNTAPLILEGCPSVGAIAMSYTHPARLSNVRAASLTVSNPFTSSAYPWVLDNCTFEYISMATVANAMGTVYLTSTTVVSSFRTGLGKLALAYYAYFATNLTGALQTTVHETILTVTTTTVASLLLQEGRYQYPAGNDTDTTGLAFSGRQMLEVINDTPGSYVVQTATGIATDGYVKYYRIIPYTSGSYGTPTDWTQIA